MTSPLQARQAAVQAVADALYEEPWTYCERCKGIGQDENACFWCTDCNATGCVVDEENVPVAREEAERLAELAVQVLLGTPDTPCPECEAGLLFEGTGWVGLPFQCERCDGSGVVPGQPALRMPCERCNGTKLAIYGVPFEEREPCPDCTDGFGLAAIDVARGGELLTERLLDEPCPFDTVLVRFPYRRVTGEQT